MKLTLDLIILTVVAFVLSGAVVGYIRWMNRRDTGSRML